MIAWDLKTACKESGLSRGSMYKLISAGKVKSVKVGRRLFIEPESVAALFNFGSN